MRKRIFTAVVIITCLALVAAGIVVFWLSGGVMGAGGTSVGETSVQYVSINPERRISLLVWSDLNDGPGGSSGEAGLFGSSCKGFASSADGRRIDWAWQGAKEKGGDFQINGTAYDLANGTLFLVSTKGGPVRVTQLDVDLAKVQADKQGFEALAKDQPKITQFLADAAERK